MLNKFRKYKSTFSFKKVGILLGALLLTIGLGNGMNMAFAGQGIDSLLATWFESEKDKAVEGIDKAIEEEIASLSKELRVAVEKEKKNAEEELAKFTEDQKQIRTSELQDFAATLKANIKIDLTKEKEAIIAKLDAKQKQDIEDLKKTSTPIEPIPEPSPGVIVQPDPTPETEEGTKPELAPEPEPEATAKPDPDASPETTPESESAQ